MLRDINHPARNALRDLGDPPDPAVRSLFYRWIGYVADVKWGRKLPGSRDHGANMLRHELMIHFGGLEDLNRAREIIVRHVENAVAHAKAEGAKKRAEEHRLTLEQAHTEVVSGYSFTPAPESPIVRSERVYLGDGQFMDHEIWGSPDYNSARYQK